MNGARATSVLTVLLVAGTLLATGTLGSGGAPDRSADGLDDGTATVRSVGLTDAPAITDGRFGTGVAYLRLPDATIDLESVDGRPRAVYSVEVPGLDFDRASTTSLAGDPSRVTIGMADRAFEYDAIDRGAYEARVTVRIQSFAVDRTVLERNASVEVRTDG